MIQQTTRNIYSRILLGKIAKNFASEQVLSAKQINDLRAIVGETRI